MRNTSPRLRWLPATLTFATLVVRAGDAAAQADLTPPLPNVMLLIDTSGSMEYMADGTAPLLDNTGKCQAPLPGKTNMNRWATLVSVLTGSVQGFSCYAQPRTKSSPFETEYSLSGVAPYDVGYHLPFHRILSNDCTPGPGTLGATWPGWPNDAIKFHAWNDANAACAGAGFQQAADGLLDTFSDRARFGLMTFDPSIDPGVGASGTSYDAVSGVQGTWSYYLGWNGVGSPATGNPPSCAVHAYEVGARNPAAPPWEGRLMPFGAADADAATLLANNQHIQLALLAMRPYGATPLAGMLEDARDFIYSDTSTDPSTGKPMGPAGDDYALGGCRKTYNIVLSDGEPNLDLRKEGCATGDGKCPYLLPGDTAHDMATYPIADRRVSTFAVGFGLSSAAGIDCNTLTCADFQGGGVCVTPASTALAACCQLTLVACEGGTNKAYFADDIGTLKTALSTVLGQITSSSKTRTIPAFGSTAASAAVQGNAKAVGYRFGAQFDTPANSPLWVGRLVRERYECIAQGNGPKKSAPQDKDTSKGDDFAQNLNSNDSAHPRKFWSAIASTISGKIYSARSIRPKLVAANKDDGMGLYDAPTSAVSTPVIGPTFASQLSLSSQALAIDPVVPPNQCATQLGTASGTTCANRLLRWEVGEVDSGLPTRDSSGCVVTNPVTGETMGCELGSIYHSTPVVVGAPNEFLRDESYDAFATAQAARPTMLYTSTTDGQLHAFKVSASTQNDSLKVDKLENNELWSFLPPAVLPRLLTTYNQQAILLDGQVVVRDVVLERTPAQAIAGIGGAGPQWKTILLGGGGGGGGYYFALDVTDPTQPEFLWQLSLDFENAEIFGSTVPTPAIATITISENGGAPKDVAVAVMAGGSDALLAGTCPRVVPPPYPKVDGVPTTPRSSTRCWAQTGGRSLTIARLDTGEVIKTFVSPKAAITPNLAPGRKIVAPFDSPLTGVPVPYPSKSGQIANRVYIGDADGTMWRLDLSKTNPDNWTVDLMWDAYQGLADDAGQPIQTPPVISINSTGQPVLLFATGDQELINSTSPKTRLWSVREEPNGASSFIVKSNFVIDTMVNGERVTGPISLFAGTAYFSSFKPDVIQQGPNACSYGEGRLWGIDYVSGEGRIDPLDKTAKYLSAGANTIVFGVAVTQTPSCSDTTTFDSPYFGSYTGATGGSAGEFQLVYQVSGQQSAPQVPGVSPVFKTKVLPPPRVTTRIDSWASIVE